MTMQQGMTYNQNVRNSKQGLSTAMQPVTISQTSTVNALRDDATGYGRQHKQQ